ncbi:helix-turn-helix domain-containing protein [Candidatus Sumerlaeota bacterium]|nr:helix-turn-helix domain-containing protein [Candidatus Sumerlaeota bacterium]
MLNMEDDLLNVEEVAAYLKVSPKTIYRLLKRGEIPAARIGHHWRFDRKTINTWVSRESMKNLRDIA